MQSLQVCLTKVGLSEITKPLLELARASLDNQDAFRKSAKQMRRKLPALGYRISGVIAGTYG